MPNFVIAAEPSNQTPTNSDRTDILKNALDSDQALPDALFGVRKDSTGKITNYGCKASFSPSETAGGTDQTAQNVKNRDVLIGCLGHIIRLMFIITVVVTIIKIAAAQLGIVAFGGEDSRQGGAVVTTRKSLEEGLVGIALIAGAMLILELFNSGFVDAFSKLFGGK